MKKRAGNRIIWKPETLREYSELAKNVIVWHDEMFPPSCPLAYRVHDGAALTLNKAVEIIKKFRMPKSKLAGTEADDFETDSGDVFWEVRQIWAFDVCYLWECLGLHGFKFRRIEFCERYWPRSPKVQALAEVGAAALEVVDFFAGEVADIIFKALKAACGRVKYDGLFPEFITEEPIVLEPTLEPKAENWLKGIRAGLAERFPSSEWTQRRIELDHRSLLVQLEFEAVQAEKTRKATEYAGESSEKRPQLTDTESNIVEALGTDTLHAPELLKIAGYDNSSHYRSILSNLVKREILGKNDKGYYAKNPGSPSRCQ
ncbi:MAG: hypothetical protein ACYS21_04540 [Planctomycetota bacterium]|jgi:hypothetical protein